MNIGKLLVAVSLAAGVGAANSAPYHLTFGAGHHTADGSETSIYNEELRKLHDQHVREIKACSERHKERVRKGSNRKWSGYSYADCKRKSSNEYWRIVNSLKSGRAGKRY